MSTVNHCYFPRSICLPHRINRWVQQRLTKRISTPTFFQSLLKAAPFTIPSVTQYYFWLIISKGSQFQVFLFTFPPTIALNPHWENQSRDFASWRICLCQTANLKTSRRLTLRLNGPTVKHLGEIFITWVFIISMYWEHFQYTFPLTNGALWYFGSPDVSFLLELVFSVSLSLVLSHHGRMATGPLQRD